MGTDDVVYLSGVGLQTIDVSDPKALTQVSGADLPFAAAGAALNGSGLVLVTAEGRGLEIYAGDDPQNTGAFLTRIATPGRASDVAIAAGIAYVADGSGGLQVANYLPFDAAGQAPELRIRGDVADLDRQTPGVQVLAGTSIPIQVDVSDDVQVRQVELLVNGEAVRHDLSFPFDLSAIAQSSDSSASTVEVQVRATDTGGNETLSNRLTFDWVPDTFAPTIEAIDPTDGAETAQNLRRITVRFSEAIDAATAVAANFQLRNAAEEILTPETIQRRSDDKIVQLTYEPLAAGDYTLAIEGTAVTDRAGNALDTGVVTRSFSLLEGTIAWIGGSGSWHDATNWSTGTLPTADDIVIIDVPGEVTVRFEGGSAVVANLLSEEHVALAGGELTLTGASELNQGLSFSDGSLKMEADTILAGASRWSGGILDGAGALLNQGELMVSEGYAKELRSELTNTGILRQSSSFFDNQGTFNNRAGGLYEWLGGDLRGEGEFINQGQLTIAGVGGKKFVGNLTNEGTIAHVSSEIEFLERTFLKNSASGIYDLQAGRLATFFDENDNMEGGIFNEGIFRKSTDGSATVASIFESSGGRVEVQAGQLNLIGSTIQNGRLAVERDGVLAFAGGNVLNGTIEGDGLVRFNRNSNIIADGQVVFDLGEAGLEWLGSTLRGEGEFINRGRLLANSDRNVLSTQLTNEGTLMQWERISLRGQLSNGILHNSSSGVYEWSGGDLSGSGEFINQGQLIVNGDNGRELSGPLTNRGTVEVQQGGLELSQGGSGSGTYRVAAGSQLEFAGGTHQLMDGYSVMGEGTVILSRGIVDVSADGGSGFAPGVFEHAGGTFKIS